MQTLNGISAENNSTIIFPVPIDIMSSILDIQQQQQPQPQHPQHGGHPTTAQQQQQVLSSETEHLKQTIKVSLIFFL